MREDQLLELLGEAADRHVLAADQPVRKRKPWRRRLALAACAEGILFSGAAVFYQKKRGSM